MVPGIGKEKLIAIHLPKTILFMKNYLFKVFAAVLLAALTIGVASCKTSSKRTVTTKSSTSSKPLPPGQAKKVYGDKSAKKHAPGQQKKKKNKKS